ncbi:MAG: MAE_28990/MAE_18760 family HEPN-like nuclease [Sphaerospermopsis kisseleviana]
MKPFIRDFQKRVAEIEKYFDLVDKIENLGVLSTNSITFPSGEYIVDSDLQKILKSHCYLLLYNLIESSIRNGIVAIHEAISLEGITYKDLSSKIKMIWLANDKSKIFIDSFLDSSMQNENQVVKDNLANKLKELLESVIDNTEISLSIENIPISGNLDSKTIEGLKNMYGFYGDQLPKKEIDHILDKVVKLRCDLAHGNYSFSEVSNLIPWHQIVDEKNKIVEHLTKILQNIDKYIDEKKFLSA